MSTETRYITNIFQTLAYLALVTAVLSHSYLINVLFQFFRFTSLIDICERKETYDAILCLVGYQHIIWVRARN